MSRYYMQIKAHVSEAKGKLEQALEVQFISDLIRTHVRRSGFSPCMRIEHLMAYDHRYHRSFINAIEMNQHGFMMGRMYEVYERVTSFLDLKRIQVTRNRRLLRKRPLLIADCFHAEIMQSAEIQLKDREQIISFTEPLKFQYHPPVYVGEWVETQFYTEAKTHEAHNLYYKIQQRTEVLSPLVRAIKIRVFHLKNKMSVSVALHLISDETVVVDTMVQGQ